MQLDLGAVQEIGTGQPRAFALGCQYREALLTTKKTARQERDRSQPTRRT